MTRLIDADAMHIDFDRYVEHIRLMKKGRIPKTEIAILLDCKGTIDNAPTVDAVPVRHGKWIIEDGHVCCSECGEISKEYNWCPYCGARMDEE